MKFGSFVLLCVVVLVVVVASLYAQGGTVQLLGSKGQRITVGEGLSLSASNVLSVIFPSASEQTEVELLQDSASAQTWRFPVGMNPLASSVKLFYNGVRFKQGLDYTFGADGSGEFVVINSASVISQTNDDVLVDFRE